MTLLLTKILKNRNNNYKGNARLSLKNSTNYKFEHKDSKWDKNRESKNYSSKESNRDYSDKQNNVYIVYFKGYLCLTVANPLLKILIKNNNRYLVLLEK